MEAIEKVSPEETETVETVTESEVKEEVVEPENSETESTEEVEVDKVGFFKKLLNVAKRALTRIANLGLWVMETFTGLYLMAKVALYSVAVPIRRLVKAIIRPKDNDELKASFKLEWLRLKNVAKF